jgi:hypothetical protein
MTKDVGYRVESSGTTVISHTFRSLWLSITSSQDCLLNLRANQLVRLSPAPARWSTPPFVCALWFVGFLKSVPLLTSLVGTGGGP